MPNKSSFSLFFGGRRPNNGWNMNGMVDYALTKDQTLRLQYSQNASSRSNLGIGGFDLAERAYSSESSNHELRLQEAGPIGRRSYLNTRLELNWNRSESASQFEAPTIRVLDGVTTGGAQVKGGNHQKDFEFGSDLAYIRGIHSMRTGIQVEGRHSRADDASNYLGTFVFSSTADFVAGKPRNYTRRIGDPLITYSHLQAGLYVQDDVKLRANLTVSPGLRYEAQTHVHDLSGFAPRLGLTWAPGKDGKTTVRTSAGVFYNWFGAGTYAQTLRVNGFRQQEINIDNPTYPDLGGAAVLSTTNKYVLGDLEMERSFRISAAVDRTLTPKVRVSLTSATSRFTNQLRGLNLNAQVNGVRPDPLFANVIQVVPDASSRNYDLIPDININFAGGIRNATQAKWNPRRTVIRFNYRYHRGFNVSVNNLTDRANYTGFSGVMTSQYFQQPTSVANPRQVDFSVRFGF